MLSNFLEKLNRTIISKSKGSIKSEPSKIIIELCHCFDLVEQILNETPPVRTQQKFGNPSFRVFLEKLWQNAEIILRPSVQNQEAIEYFLLSFGSWSRNDFGTGHEFNFLAFLTCLDSLEIICESDYEHLIFDVFWRYWKIIRQIQLFYRPSPAGSLGVWGIDDYVLLPFLFGSAQLIHNLDSLTPNLIFDNSIAEKYSSNYIFCTWISFLHQIKGELSINAPMLFSLNKFPSFDTLNDHLMKLYHKLIFDKLVIIEQFYFGTILTLQ